MPIGAITDDVCSRSFLPPGTDILRQQAGPAMCEPVMTGTHGSRQKDPGSLNTHGPGTTSNTALFATADSEGCGMYRGAAEPVTGKLQSSGGK